MSHKSDSLGERMKGYEAVSRNFLTRRIPAIIRVDGKAFHTFTKDFRRPFDAVFRRAMKDTMQYLCSNIQGCVLGYTQSDEITLILKDYEKITTSAWFDYNVQKMTSIAASMATLAFNSAFKKAAGAGYNTGIDSLVYEQKFDTAMFDARVFSVPKEEVANCLIWRQQDAVRNSIQSVGQFYFTQKELQGKSGDEIQEMLFQKYSINWNDYPIDEKRGSCCTKDEFLESISDPRHPGQFITVNRRRWVVDDMPPIFSKERSYIEKYL